MSVWKKIPVPPGGVMPAGMVTKIGIAATSLLLAAMLLTYSFTGGGEPEAGIEVPEAAGFDLQQRAQAAIEAEARRQAGQLRQQAASAERQLAQLQSEQESNAAILGAGIVPLPGQDPGGVLLADDQAVPFAGDAPRTEAEAVLLETLRLEEMERRRRSLRTGPLVLSYRNSDPGADATAAAGAQLPDTLSGLLQAAQVRPDSPGRPSRRHRRKRRLDGRRTSSHCSPNSMIGNWPLRPSPRRGRETLPCLSPGWGPRRKLPWPGGLPIRTVGTVFMKDRF